MNQYIVFEVTKARTATVAGDESGFEEGSTRQIHHVACHTHPPIFRDLLLAGRAGFEPAPGLLLMPRPPAYRLAHRPMVVMNRHRSELRTFATPSSNNHCKHRRPPPHNRRSRSPSNESRSGHHLQTNAGA